MSDIDFKELVSGCKSWAELQKKMGYPLGKDSKNPSLRNKYCFNFKKKIEKRCNNLGIVYDHLYFKLKPRNEMKSKRRRTSCLRNIMKKSEKLYMCEICRCEDMDLHDGEWIWNGKPIQLEIDHLKGNNCTDDDAAMSTASSGTVSHYDAI